MTPSHNLDIFPILLAGGSGTRLWPVSRTQTPKQLVEFGGEASLLQETVQRLHPVFNTENVRVVCGQDHCEESAKHLNALGLSTERSIIAEPVGRNTAPAVLLAVQKVLRQENIRDAVLFILPADHAIKDVPRFHQTLEEAVILAEKGYLVTFGIQPYYAETGYGYIEGGKTTPDGGLFIKRFVEKPDIVTAEAYLEAGNFFWNSGMFAFQASVILKEYQRYQPQLSRQMNAIVHDDEPISTQAYQDLENISFDIAIMENTNKGVVLPSDFGWSDIGSWKSLHDHLHKTDNDNVSIGDVVLNNTKNSLVISKSRLVTVNDLADIAIVETPDAVFVSRLETSRRVKEVVALLQQKNRKELKNHLLESHPWGTIQYLEQNPTLIVAKLMIRPQKMYWFRPSSPGYIYLSLLSGSVEISYPKKEEYLQNQGLWFSYITSDVSLHNRDNTDLMAIFTYYSKGSSDEGALT